jgi:hypothetical protein
MKTLNRLLILEFLTKTHIACRDTEKHTHKCCYYIVKMKEKSNFRKGLERVLASGIIFVGSLVGSVKAEGVLNIDNRVELQSNNNTFNAQHLNKGTYPQVSDGKDIYDTIFPGCLSESSALYSEIPSWKLMTDSRPNDTNLPCNIKLVYNGTLSSDKKNWLEFNFPYPEYTFEPNEPILFQSERLPHGPVVDVRRAINQNSGDVPLIKLSTNPWE